jgi:hypothetical protein
MMVPEIPTSWSSTRRSMYLDPNVHLAGQLRRTSGHDSADYSLTKTHPHHASGNMRIRFHPFPSKRIGDLTANEMKCGESV